MRIITRILTCTALVAMAWIGAGPAEAAGGLHVEEEWTRAIFGDGIGGDGIGGAGLNVADLDGSGELKIVASARGPYSSPSDTAYYWHVLSPSPEGYRQEWASSPYPGTEFTSGVSAVRTVDVDGAPGAEIVVASNDEIFVYDGATRDLLHSVQTQAQSIEDLQVADSDGDGDLELVFCEIDRFSREGSGLFVYDLATGREELASDELPCTEVAVGNVEGDTGPEIVLGGSRVPGRIVDGVTHRLKWTEPSGFGSFVQLGDVDGDGLEEIVDGPYGGSSITIYDADRRSPAWTIHVESGLYQLAVLDLEGDGRLDIVYGTSVGRTLFAWDARARVPKWTRTNPEKGIDALAAGDVDGDGERELVWSAGGLSTGPDYLFVADARTRELEWQSQDLRGPFRALDSGDVDADGRPELLYASSSSDNHSRDGRYFIHDARTKELEYASEPPAGIGSLRIRRIRHADVDADPQAEIFVAASDGHTGGLVAYDGLTHAEQWRWEASRHEGVHSLEAVDIDGDGAVELVVGGEDTLYVLDGATGEEEWRATDFGAFPELLRVADVDSDPSLEILVAVSTGRVSSFDGVTHARELDTSFPLPVLGLDEVTALETADRDGDGTDEIFLGTSDGEVVTLDAATGAVDETVARYEEPIHALAVIDLTEDRVPDLVVALPERVEIYDGRTPSERLWSSGLIGYGVGEHDSLRIDDLDRDARHEILVNLGVIGVKIFRVDGPGPEVPPGPYLTSPDLLDIRFKVRITAGDRTLAGNRETDCIDETVCVSGALPGRSELFLRPIGPRPNGFLWMNLVRFTPARVEVWAEQISSGRINYYDLPALPRGTDQLAGLVDKQAFPPEGAVASTPGSVRVRPVGAPGVVSTRAVASSRSVPVLGTRAASFVPDAFPGYRFTVRIVAGGEEQAVRLESDCLPETVCVSGALPGRSELFLRLIGPRPNGYFWSNLVRFTTSRVEVEIERLATGRTRTYVLEEVPRQSDRLPGRIDREAFVP